MKDTNFIIGTWKSFISVSKWEFSKWGFSKNDNCWFLYTGKYQTKIWKPNSQMWKRLKKFNKKA